MLFAAAAMFGGVYAWSAVVLALAIAGLGVWCGVPHGIAGEFRARSTGEGDPFDPAARWVRLLDLSLVGVLGGILLQLVPLPAVVVAVISPARLSYVRATALQAETPSWLTLTLDPSATLHGALATFCGFAAFWTARAIFARGGVRVIVTTLAACAVALVLVAVAQAATSTELVYGFWRPIDAGARPLGPFINRNHFGTWSLLAFFLLFGCLQWRRAAGSPPRGWNWRGRVAHALDGRSMILVLAMVLLVLGVAVGASRSTMLALTCGAGYVAATAPGAHGRARHRLWSAAFALAAVLAVVVYADLDRLLSRVDETRQLGLSGRSAIWRDTLRAARDFPVAGVGAGSFSMAMRLYQASDRTYFWNEAHNHVLQVAVEGGLLLAIPSGIGLVALTALTFRTVRRRDDAAHWVRLGASAALVAVAVQSMWETGLTLPANGMLAGVAAALVVRSPHSARQHRSPRPASASPAPEHDNRSHAAAWR